MIANRFKLYSSPQILFKSTLYQAIFNECYDQSQEMNKEIILYHEIITKDFHLISGPLTLITVDCTDVIYKAKILRTSELLRGSKLERKPLGNPLEKKTIWKVKSG